MASTLTAVSPRAATLASGATESTTASRTPQKALGQSDFLKLLAVQFQVQDPMKPMEDTSFIAQMAQFSSLEQSNAMVSGFKTLQADQRAATANSYLGHRVTVDLGDGKSFTGDVTAVDASSGNPQLVVGDKPYPLSAVLRVEPSLLPLPAQPATNSGGA